MKKINVWFECVKCGSQILPADKTCRNHCNQCFACLHVDTDMPGDRLADCGGIMYPIEYEIFNWNLKILFKCTKCWKLHRNKAAKDDNLVNLDALIYEYKRFF